MKETRPRKNLSEIPGETELERRLLGDGGDPVPEVHGDMRRAIRDAYATLPDSRKATWGPRIYRRYGGPVALDTILNLLGMI